MAVGQNQWYHFGVGAPPILVYFSGDWDVHWGYGLFTHGHVVQKQRASCRFLSPLFGQENTEARLAYPQISHVNLLHMGCL